MITTAAEGLELLAPVVLVALGLALRGRRPLARALRALLVLLGVTGSAVTGQLDPTLLGALPWWGLGTALVGLLSGLALQRSGVQPPGSSPWLRCLLAGALLGSLGGGAWCLGLSDQPRARARACLLAVAGGLASPLASPAMWLLMPAGTGLPLALLLAAVLLPGSLQGSTLTAPSPDWRPLALAWLLGWLHPILGLTLALAWAWRCGARLSGAELTELLEPWLLGALGAAALLAGGVAWWGQWGGGWLLSHSPLTAGLLSAAALLLGLLWGELVGALLLLSLVEAPLLPRWDLTLRWSLGLGLALAGGCALLHRHGLLAVGARLWLRQVLVALLAAGLLAALSTGLWTGL